MLKLFKSPTSLILLLLFILIVRLISLPMYPLMDTTEARYAEMSRKILELKEWIVIYYYDYNTPFWGKPPLSFWSSSVTMWLFGINEFGARLAPFIFTMLTIALFFLWDFGRKDGERYSLRPLACGIILFSSGVGFVASGAVMTDASLLFCVALCMICFWRSVVYQSGDSVDNSSDFANDSSELKKRKIFGYGFFVGLGLGLLAKGPLIFVLVGLPIFVFITATKISGGKFLRLKNLPFISGSILTLLIAAPWYVAFEVKSSGFLEYFIIGEHIKRFLVSGWEGSLYGAAHSEPIGMIWWFFLIAFLPWSVIFICFLIAKSRFVKSQIRIKSLAFYENLYLLLWVFMPLIFMTFSRNILEAYTLPCAPALCILCANFIFNAGGKIKNAIFFIPLVLMMIVSVFLTTGKLDELVSHRHYKDVFTAWDGESRLVFIDSKPSFSAYFYAHKTSKNKLKDEFIAFDSPQMSEILQNNEKIAVAMKQDTFNAKKAYFSQWRQIISKKDWVLLKNY